MSIVRLDGWAYRGISIKKVLSILAVFSFGASGNAEVTVHPLFNPNMVLQCGKRVRIWGKAAAGEKVEVKFNRQAVSATTGKDGRWQLWLEPMNAGGPFDLHINEKVIKNVLVGDVWFCSGQSNMAWPVSQSNHAKEEMARANHPNLRLVQIQTKTHTTPQWECKGIWRTCTTKSVAKFSAVAYFCARELLKHRNIPIGLVQSTWGGTHLRSWTRPKDALAMPHLEGSARDFNSWSPERLAAERAAQETRGKDWQDWRRAAKTAQANGETLPPAPARPYGKQVHHRTTAIYNGSVHPVTTMTIKGIWWYQGEANDGNPDHYGMEFQKLIEGWREQWQDPKLPFYFVQIANWKELQTDPKEKDAWGGVRLVQTAALALPNTGMATAVDLGKAHDVHPRDKQTVGYRLSLVVRKHSFGEDILYSGPRFKNAVRQAENVVISFNHLGRGLKTKGDKLEGFAVRGKDNKLVWARAEIKGNTVVLTHPARSEISEIRYKFAINPLGNLYNKEDMPALPFNTKVD